MPKNTWTPEQTNMLMEQWPTINDPRKLEAIIGKTYKAIKSRATKLKLKRIAPSPQIGKSKASPEDDQYIKDHYLTTPVNTMAKHLGYSETLIKGRMRFLKLIVPKEIRDRFREMGMIRKGNVPPNKGKKQSEYMSSDAIERTRATRFQKGQTIYNEAYDGAIRLRQDHPDRGGRPYYFIRIAKAKWELLHRHIWMQENGPIPEGMLVVFKDGNTLNCTIDNLEMITMAENQLRNSASKNLTDGYIANSIAWRDPDLKKELLNHPELIELKRQQLLLKREIYEQQQKSVS